MLVLAIIPAVVSLATSVLAYEGPLAHSSEHVDATNSQDDVMTEINAILDKLFNTASNDSTTTSSESTDNTEDPWANIKLDPYMSISNHDQWCPHGEGNYCGEYIGKDPSILWHCSVYNGQAHWSKQADCSKGCKCKKRHIGKYRCN
jgi:hypothetical protein